MNYLLIALFLFCVLNAKNSLIFLFCAAFICYLLIRKKQFTKKLILFFVAFIFSYTLNTLNFSTTSYVGVVCEAKENYYLFSSFKGKFYIYEKDNQKNEGDIIKINGKRVLLEHESIEEQFDFNKFLNNKGYYYRLYVEEEKMIIKSIFSRKNFLNKIKNNLSYESFSLVKSLFFGETEKESYFYYLSENLMFYPFINISGSFFSFIKNKTFKLDKKKPKKWLFWVILLPFILLRPNRFLWIRLLVFEIINYASKKKGIKLSLIKKVSLSMIVILFINPYYAYQSSFILSYLILIMLALVIPLIKRKKRFIRKSIPFLLTQVILMFYNWYINYEVNLLLPILSLSTPLFFVFDCVLYVFLFLNFSLGLEQVTKIYMRFLKLFEGLRINVVLGQISLFILFLVMVFTLFSLVEFSKNNNRYLKNNLVIIFMLLIGEIIPFNKLEQSITFINVGQGDSILIKNKGQTLLIDTGGSTYFNVATESLIPYFKRNQISSLDYLLITHEDYDHMGGREELINQGYIKNIINENTVFPFNFNGIYINNLNIWQNEFKEKNNKSYVLSFKVNNKSWLLMGDAEEKVEKKMLNHYKNLHHDYLKIGHHGSNTSSSLSFLKAVSPKVAIISCGKNNRYGHPSKEVISRLNKLDIEIKRTDVYGTIKFYL